jgi:transcriptional regulator with XRE-family HTH domain
MDKKEFGAYMRKLRKDLGLTKTKVVADAKISPTYLWHIEKGHSKPSPEKLQALARVYRKPLRELLDAAGYPKEPALDKSEMELVEAAFKLATLDRDNEFIKKISSLVPSELSQEMKQVIIIAYEMISGKKLL